MASTAPRGPGRRDANKNRRALLEASAHVLAADPTASMDEIAARAGLGRATVYRHVAGRDELVQEVAEAALASAARAVRTAAPDDGPALDALRRVLTALVREGAEHRPLLLLGIARDAQFAARRADVLAPIAGIVARGVAAGDLRSDLSPEWALSALLALLQTAVSEGRPNPVQLVWTTVIEGWVPR